MRGRGRWRNAAGGKRHRCGASSTRCPGSACNGAWYETVIAYEPVWAIGTGETATPQQAQENARRHPRPFEFPGRQIGAEYGLSTEAASTLTMPRRYSRRPDIDGGLVGGASLDAVEFFGICGAAARNTPLEESS